MNIAIYYCHACGNRLQKDEADVSLARGESFSTACCEKCAQAGKRIKDPKTAEEAELQVRPSTASAENPISSDSAEISAIHLPVAAPRMQTPPRGTRTGATAVIQRPPATISSERRNERSSKKPGFSIIPFAVAAMLFISIFAYLATRRNETEISFDKNPAPASRPDGVPTENANRDLPVGGESATSPSTEPAAAAPRVSGGADSLKPAAIAENAQYSTELVESHLKYKNYVRAWQALDELEKSLPGDDKYAAIRTKITVLREDCLKASQGALNEMLKIAEVKAEAGEIAGVRQVLSPQRMIDLLPQHAEAAQNELDTFVQKAQTAAKLVEEKKQAEIAAMRASFDSKLPAEGTLPALAENLQLLFGPGFLKNVRHGTDTIKTPAGKIPYTDLSKKFEIRNASGLLYKVSVVLDYCATEPVQCTISVNVKDVGWAGSTVTLPAGDMKQETVILTNDLIKKKGTDLSGRSITDLKLEIKSAKPGTVGVFRISIQK